MKKAQMYIFTAIVLSTVAIGIFVYSGKNPLPDNEFALLVDNYQIESIKSLQSAYYNNTPLSVRQYEFADSYYTYARAKSPLFGFAAILSDGDYVRIDNRLGFSARIIYNGSSAVLNSMDNITVANSGNISVYVYGNSYDFNTSSSLIQEHALLFYKRGRDINAVQFNG